MPYMKVHEGENVDVYKKGPDGKPEGKRLGRHKSDADADKQIAAIHVNEKAFQVGSKYWDDDFISMPDLPMKLEPGDARVQYTPLGGTDTQACANCQWFCARNASCCLVWDDIVATGKCNLHLAKPDPGAMSMSNPVPVVIVADQTGSAEAGEPAAAAPVETAKKERPGILDWLKDLFVKPTGEPLPQSGFKSLPDNKWVAFFTNNFEDKAGQTFPETAHKQYVEWVDSGQIPYPELWYWHMLGTRHGQAEWIDYVDHIMIAAGSYDDTPDARAYQQEVSQNPHKVSFTYGYPGTGLLPDGTYTNYFAIEISPLPAGKEANEITRFITEVKEMPVTAEKREALIRILGKERAEQVLGDGAKLGAQMEAVGIKFKEGESLTVEDKEARAAIQALAVANKEAVDAAIATLTETVNKAVAALQAEVKVIGEKAAAQQTQATGLEAFVKEQFKLEPRASQAAATIVPKESPMATMLSAKAADPAAPTPAADGTPPDAFNTIAGWFMKPPAAPPA